jgi:hypothetical protein
VTFYSGITLERLFMIRLSLFSVLLSSRSGPASLDLNPRPSPPPRVDVKLLPLSSRPSLRVHSLSSAGVGCESTYSPPVSLASPKCTAPAPQRAHGVRQRPREEEVGLRRREGRLLKPICPGNNLVGAISRAHPLPILLSRSHLTHPRWTNVHVN